MMKEKYEAPSVELVKLNTENILAASGEDNEQGIADLLSGLSL